MMKNRILSIVCSLLLAVVVMAQDVEEMTIHSFTYEPKDLTAAVNKVLDANGVPAALIKVQLLSESEIQFQSVMIMGDVSFQANEYRVYMVAGSKSVRISHPKYPSLNVVFSEVSGGQIKSLQSQCTYRLVVNVPTNDLPYAELKTMAQQKYDSIAYHTDTEFFLHASKLFESAMGHKDCPTADMGILQKQCRDMKLLRKYTYLYQKMKATAEQNTLLYGFESDSVCLYLKRTLSAAKKITDEFRQENFLNLEKDATAALQKHPCGKDKVTQLTEVQNRHVVGRVTYQSELDMSTVEIYAAHDEKTKVKEMLKIGGPKADGTYSVIVPKGYDYLCFYTGKKYIYLIANYKVNTDPSDQNYRLDVTLK